MKPNFDLKHVQIEAATPRHAPRLLKLIEAYYLFDGIPFNRKAIMAGLSLLLSDPALGAAWLLLNRGKAVG